MEVIKCRFGMRSKVAKRIQNETPEEVRIFVRQYTDILVRINEIIQEKGYTQKDLADEMQKKLQRLTNG
jgi:ribosome-binding protein aMBF1 (putative translation factor)